MLVFISPKRLNTVPFAEECIDRMYLSEVELEEVVKQGRIVDYICLGVAQHLVFIAVAASKGKVEGTNRRRTFLPY